MKKYLYAAGFTLFIALVAAICVRFYPYIFAKTVTGTIASVERVTSPNTIIATDSVAVPKDQIFSFAIAIKDSKGEMHTASSEDRQWAVAKTGQCVEAKYFPYPFWNLDKSGTYYGARLIRLFDCPNI